MAGVKEGAAARAQPSSADPQKAETAATMRASTPARAPKASQPERAETRSRVPLAAVLAILGLTASTAVVCAAVAFRNVAVVTAIEQRAVQGPGPGPRATTTATPSGSADASASPSASAEPSVADTPQPRASAADLEEARSRGVAALAALAERYPKDLAVLRALATAQARDRATLMHAILTVKRLLEVEASEATNPEIRQVVLRAANGTPEVAAVAFELLSSKMGSHGPDLLYEILIAQGMGKLPQDRAEALLNNEEVRKLATPALLVANELRRARKCPDKALLEQVKQHGDTRSLHYLKSLMTPKKCGFLSMNRCTPCTSVHADVRAAATAIEKRRDGP